jgi:hypothetical protein
MTTTSKYGLEEVSYGVTGWNAILTANMQIVDAAIHTVLEADSGQALTQWDAVYLKSDGKWWKAKADAAATMPALGLAIEAAAGADVAVRVQRVGLVTNAGWSWTAGQLLYVSGATAGALTATPPANYAQPVGIAASATTAFLFVGLAGPGATVHVAALRLTGANNALGAAAVTDPDAITAETLTDSSGGSKDNTIEAVSGTGADAAINNNFAELADEQAKLKADVTEVRSHLVSLLAALRSTTGVGVISG